MHILMADDDPDDRLLLREAMEEMKLTIEVSFVVDGQDLMDYLNGSGAYADDSDRHLPDLILLDLNMPRKDGREALGEIKANPDLRKIPIVALTTSAAEEDILRTYDLGVNSFITKPVTFDKFTEVVHGISEYWFNLVKLPRK